MSTLSEEETVGIDEVFGDSVPFLEKWFEAIQTPGPVPTCDICLYSDSFPTDQLVTCEFCKVSVHQCCYRKEVNRTTVNNRPWY